MHPDGRLSQGGSDVADAETFLATLDEAALETIRLVPDRELPAAELVALARERE